MTDVQRYLCLEDYPPGNLKFINEHGVKLFHIGIFGNKEPFVDISQKDIASALSTLTDVRNHPILIHCNKGKVCVPFVFPRSVLIVLYSIGLAVWWDVFESCSFGR